MNFLNDKKLYCRNCESLLKRISKKMFKCPKIRKFGYKLTSNKPNLTPFGIFKSKNDYFILECLSSRVKNEKN